MHEGLHSLIGEVVLLGVCESLRKSQGSCTAVAACALLLPCAPVQEGLVGLVEGASPTDSPRSSAAAGDGPSRSASHSRGSRTDRPGQVSRGSQGSISGDSSGAAELGASPPSGRYDVGLGERYVGSLPGREQLHHLAHT
jgi:hypothetical protein